MKSASLHSFHEEHVPPTEAGSPFQQRVREILEQLGEDPKREGCGRPRRASKRRSSG